MWDSGIQDSTALSIFGFCQPPTTNDGFKRKRPSRFLSTAFIYAGNDLLSHTLSRAVQSALRGLTSVFGMGKGGSPAARSPTTCSHAPFGSARILFVIGSQFPVFSQTFLDRPPITDHR